MELEIKLLHKLHVPIVTTKLSYATVSSHFFTSYTQFTDICPINYVNTEGVSAAEFRRMVSDWLLLVRPEAADALL